MLPTQAQKDYALARNIIIYDELKEILTVLNSAGVKVIVIAGAALAETVYPNIGLRPMSDIDLLVHKTDLSRIEQALNRIGYVWEIGRRDEQHYHNPDPGLAVHIEIDIHNRLPYLDSLSLQGLWTRAVKRPLAGVETLVLSPEDTLIYTAADATIHHARISQICLDDMARIINNAERKTDWLLVTKLIRQYRLEAPLYYALGVAIKQTRINIPPWVLKAIRPVGGNRWSLMVYKFVLKERLVLGDDIAPVLRFITRPNRFRLFLELFLPSPGFMKPRYELSSQRSVYFYYPIRMVSLLGRGIKVTGRLLRRL